MNETTAITSHGLFIHQKWQETEEKLDVLHKYTQQVFAQVSVATEENVHEAVQSATGALEQEWSPYERYQVLRKTADLLLANKEAFAQIIMAEAGKPIRDARVEVERAAMTLEVSAEEAKRIVGEVVPVEAAQGSENRLAFTVKSPIGVIAAITPFNVPLNLVCHKVGPALAAGNSVVLKPAEVTPVCAAKLVELFVEAGLPEGRIQFLTGDGPTIGGALLRHPGVQMVTFTGSPKVGEWIQQHAGMKKVSLELGNNSATIVHSDADLEKAASLIVQKSFNSAGQVCISVQRVFVHKDMEAPFIQLVKRKTAALVVGDPSVEETDIGPLIRQSEAERVERWVEEAIDEGAELVIGGVREGAFYHPTILRNVKASMNVCKKEVFGPVFGIETFETGEEAIAKVNDSEYGLQAGIFTKDLAFAMHAAKKIHVGGVMVNDASMYRVDHMPYGGVKRSGTGKEGPKYAMEEMMEEKIIVFNL